DGDQAKQGADERGFAGAVGTEKTDGARRYLSAEIAKGFNLSVAFADVGERKQHRDSSVTMILRGRGKPILKNAVTCGHNCIDFPSFLKLPALSVQVLRSGTSVWVSQKTS